MLKPRDYIVYDPNVKVVEVPAGWGEESKAAAMAPAVTFSLWRFSVSPQRSLSLPE